MNHYFVGAAPKGPIIMESSQQYLHAGSIAVQIAEFIRRLGFEARAHIDANYQVICPVVAQDAGLGVIGRMGLLMTPKLGPRVRIGVVTTDMELLVTKTKPDSSTIKFCEICKKCAQNCPSQAIPFHSNPKQKKQIERWLINHEACFIYWNVAGTDCGRCISVCPFSHPDNLIHNLIRWFIKQNEFNRRLALFMDNFFYGKKPNPKKLISWMLPN
jgi:reductive dehalogenase